MWKASEVIKGLKFDASRLGKVVGFGGKVKTPIDPKKVFWVAITLAVQEEDSIAYFLEDVGQSNNFHFGSFQ